MSKLHLDLHCHSIASDGSQNATQLVNLALKSGLQVLSITDHDIVSAYDKFPNKLIRNSSLSIIPGVEFSARVDKGTMHILGYAVDPFCNTMQDIVKEKTIRSKYSVLAMILAIKKEFNITLPEKEIAKIVCKQGNIGRVDIAKALLSLGMVSSIEEAFKLYLKAAKELTRSNFPEMDSKTCIKAILDAGGIPILAHPKTITMDEKKLSNVIDDLIKEGLMGVELYHSSYNTHDFHFLDKLAKEKNLVTTGGSDFHGMEVKPEVKLGTGKNNNLCITNETVNILDYLEKDKYNFWQRK